MAPDRIVYVALLRGINVGGNNMVSMKSLKENFARLGFTDVKTYINSGNVIFRAAEKDPRKVEGRIDRMLADTYALKGRTVVRTTREMARVVAAIDNEPLYPDWRCNVVFLRHTVDPRRALKGVEIQPEFERVVCCPGTWLWSARLSDIHRSAMMKLGRTPLYQEMTVRNVNTTKAVLALMKAAEGA